MFKSSVAVTIGGAVLASFLQQAWWIRGLEGAALGFTTFVTFPMIYTWAKRTADPVHLTIGCSPAVMPTKLPPDGFTVVMLYPGGGGSMLGYGEPGEATGWAPNSMAYRCEVRNLSGKPLPAIAITLPIKYRNGDGSEIEPAKQFGKIRIVAQRLDAASDKPFVFFVFNPGGYGATVEKIEADYHEPDPSNPIIEIKSNLLHPIEFGSAATRMLDPASEFVK